MKNLSLLAVAGLMLSGVASAVFDPTWERPVFSAELTASEIVEHNDVATNLTLNKRDGEENFTTFTLTEDTGIRCFTTPCPSSKDTFFKIDRIITGRSGEPMYEATEILNDIPAHVRIVPRKMTVVESSMELVAPGGGAFMRKTFWDVSVKHFNQEADVYTGNPEAVFTPLSIP